MHHHFPIQQRPEVNIFYDFRDFAQIMDFIDFRLFIPVTFFFQMTSRLTFEWLRNTAIHL